MKVMVTNIQRFSLHDGPGIRTTVFLKGCNLHCPWCANPENISFEEEEYIKQDTLEIKKYGYEIDEDSLYNEIIKDKNFYENGGGVTFSGGEPLLQINKLESLLSKLRKDNINICVETSLFVPKKYLDIAKKYVDLFYVDVKFLTNELYSNILGGNLDVYLENIKILFKKVNHNNIIFRMPVTKEYTLEKNNIDNLIEFLKCYKPKKMEIFKVHKLGAKKYLTLNKKMEEFKNISDNEMKGLLLTIQKLGIQVEEKNF